MGTVLHKKAVLFGTFDGIHEGHKNLLSQAYTVASYICVVIPNDHVVTVLKGYIPRVPQEARKALLVECGIDKDAIILSNDIIGTWDVLFKINPDVVLIGYDQIDLLESLKNSTYMIETNTPYIVLKPYKEDIYKNSLLHK